jgi:hypothetical protein
MTEDVLCSYRVNEDGYSPDSEKTVTIAKIQTPSSIKEVKSFLGMTGWYRRFISGYATIAKPLTSLLEEEKTFQWSPESDNFFVTLKERVTSAPVLAHPDPSRTFVLTTDASPVGIWAESAQNIPDGLKPVAYFSRTSTKTERRYSTYDREILAMVMAVRHFLYHLF